MEATERQTVKPIGLARFLVSHRDCGEGFETLHDRRLITVFCQGCEASFSFLTESAEEPGPDVDSALAQLADPPGSDQDDQGGDASKGALPVESTPSEPERLPEPPPVGPGGVRYVSPPGPLAPGIAGPPSIRRRIVSSPRGALGRVMTAVARRWRPIALAAMGAVGTYALIALTDGGNSFSQERGASRSAEAPVSVAGSDGGSVGNLAPSVQAFAAGGPGASGLAADETQFSVALPPDWESGRGADGRVLLGPAAGGAEIQVLVQGGSGGSETAEVADAAAALLAQGLRRGARVNRVPAQPVGRLIAVAQAKAESGSRTAYVAPTDAGGYLVIEHIRDDAPATTKLQAQGVISSFEPSA